MPTAVDLVPTDPWVSALLPIARALMDIGIISALGALLLIALLPNNAGALTELQHRAGIWLRRACTLLALSTLACAVVTLAYFLGQSLGTSLRQTSTLVQFIRDTAPGRSLLQQALLAWLAGVITIYARRITHVLLAAIPLALLLLVRAQTGHSGNSAWHMLATTSWTLHLLAIGAWFGGLVAIFITIRARRDLAPRLLPRFSPIALVCYVGVWASGSVNALIRLSAPSELLTTSYGRLLLVKIALTAIAGGIAWQVRARVISPLRRDAQGGDDKHRLAPRDFARWVGVELGAMLAASLVAVRLASTAPPVNPDSGADAFTAEREVLGFNPPPAPTFLRIAATTWRPDGFWIAVVVALTTLYIVGYRRLRRRGDAWPLARLLSWLMALGLLTYVTSGPLGVYGHLLFSAHMMQHLVLVLIVPILLIAGAPTTLALRALPANRADHGPREWLIAFLDSKFLKVVSHPVIAFVNFAGGFFVFYFSGLFESLMRSHLGHTFMQAHFLITGYMFIWCITGIDPSPRKLPAPAKVGLAVLAAPFHALFSVVIMQSTDIIAADYYAQFTRLYNTNLLRDQYLGASAGWAFGEVPMVVIIIIAVVQWVRADAREAARFDRLDDERRALEHEQQDHEQPEV